MRAAAGAIVHNCKILRALQPQRFEDLPRQARIAETAQQNRGAVEYRRDSFLALSLEFYQPSVPHPRRVRKFITRSVGEAILLSFREGPGHVAFQELRGDDEEKAADQGRGRGGGHRVADHVHAQALAVVVVERRR